jgi:selenocysteine lyase/cysteine desulfurase
MNLDDIRANIIGEGIVFNGPYGARRLTYCDFAASGRAYGPIESFIASSVLPLYANTHTETTITGAQTSAFREQARQIIKSACNGSDADAVIFAGNGVTGAIHTLLSCLGLLVPCTSFGKVVKSLLKEKPIVFISAFEHHSVEIAFREAAVDVEVVKDCTIEGVDLDDLAARLARHRGRRLIGCFSAGSNVTGRLTNVAAVAQVMHAAGGIAFFDYAAAGPYVDIDMSICDAVFLSIHKFVGGPGSPGVLLAKKDLFDNAVPSMPGGGTVSFVTPGKHRFLRDIEHREEGGTPNIVGSIRAGLAMQLKMSVGVAAIQGHEQDFAARAIAALRATPGATILGDLDAPRLGTVSLLLEYTDPSSGTTKCLHHNFVVALLNDLFGIQARGGNSCAAPYSHRLLGISGADEAALERAVEAGSHGAKPGWTRLSFGWYDSDDTLTFAINAVSFIASQGWKFLNDYTFDPSSGTWTSLAGKPTLMSLTDPPNASATLPESVRPSYLDMAMSLANGPHASAAMAPTPFEAIRWFWLPGELSAS